jgi:hypothetical protein
MAVTRDMDPAYKAAYKKTASWLFKAVQEAVVKSRLTRWRDMFLVNRVIEEELKRYLEYAPVPFALGTLEPNVSREEIFNLVVGCLHRIGEERGLSLDEVEAGVERVKSSMR